MKRKISVVLIIFVMLFVLFIEKTFAASDVSVRLSVNVTPNNPAVGENVTITVGLSEINEGVKTVKFSLNYVDDVLEFVSAVAGNGWTSSSQGGTYTVSTSDNQVTTKTGTVLTITLKVKEGVGTNTQTQLSLTSISVGTDTETIDDFNDLSSTLTIREGSQGGTGSGNQVGGNEVTEDPTKNEVNGNDVAEDPTRNEVTGNDVTDGNGEPVVNTLPVQKINEIGNYTTEDKEVPEEKEVPEIPKTGEDYSIQISIIGLTILSIISYAIYKKNKI